MCKTTFRSTYPMPNLQDSYIYKDWILDLSQVRTQDWSRFDLYHQCEQGTIHRVKGVLKPKPNEPDRLGWITKDFITVCNSCEIPIPDDVKNQMRAVWNLLSKT